MFTDHNSAYVALLNIREVAQGEVDWIDQMVEVSDRITDVPNVGVQLTLHHLTVMKTVIETQDRIIAMLMKSLEQSDEVLNIVKARLNEKK